MAVNTSQKNQNRRKQSAITHGLTAVFLLGTIGFCILLLWSSFLWFSLGFEKSLDKVENLSLSQGKVVAEITRSSLLLKTQELIKDKTTKALANISIKSSDAHRALQSNIEEGIDALKENFELTDNSWLDDSLIDVYQKSKAFYLLSSACVHLLVIKATICLAAIPLFFLTSLAGLIDGLNQRAIRTASLGRESTYVFHKSLPISKKLIFWVLAFWLSLPLSMDPSLLFVALSLLLAIVMSLSASRFKKYL